MTSTLFWKFSERLLLGGARKNKVSILTFHRILKESDPYYSGEPTASEFDGLIRFLTRNFDVVKLDQFVTKPNIPGSPYRVALTFDDGYADNFEVAYPILKKYSAPATFFVSSGYLDGGVMWNDLLIETFRNVAAGTFDLSELGFGPLPTSTTAERLASAMQVIRGIKYLRPSQREEIVKEIQSLAKTAPIDSPMMTRAQLELLSSDPRNQIGGHTITHPILTNLESEDAYAEIEGGKKELEDITGLPLSCFAYPNGIPGKDYRQEHVKMVKDAGFSIAVSTSAGGVCAKSDPRQLPRFTPWDDGHTKFALRMLFVARKGGELA